ncbi:MAG: ATP-dependent RecD-like DNA helicase [Candidatus Latescibacterota bacterium]
MAKENLEKTRGIVKTITFHNDENGYTVAKIESEEGKNKKFTAVGYVKILHEGETVVLNGFWVENPEYGRQFKFQSCESVVPASAKGIERFLSSGLIKGVGPVMAERIVSHFGADTIRVLDETPELLSKVPTIKKKQAEAVITGWKRHRRISDIMIFLQTYGISSILAMKIYEQYGDETINRLQNNPYLLIRDIRGIGFVKADQIAAELGISKESPYRIRAGILFCMDDLMEKGHVFVPTAKMVETAAAALDVDADRVVTALESLKKNRELIVEEERIYRSDLHASEIALAQHLYLIASTPRAGKLPGRKEIESMIADMEKKRGIEFAPLQREAIITAAMSNVMVLTGGPGTGKTTTVLGIIDIFHRLRMSVLLCAPTGRAAKRMSETTGMEAKTIHRLLEFNPHNGKFSRNEGSPLGAHAVIVDETSMIDTALMTDLLRAISSYTTLVLVGDADQLPSIGPGSVLRDIIASGRIPTICLKEIFRQAASSKIVRNAHLINTGKTPILDNDHSGNFFFIKMRTPEEITRSIVDMVARRLPTSYGFDPLNDIQVLSPMHRGETGVMNLNVLLQERLNPFNPRLPEVRMGNWVFRQGDKVMQTRNNYDKMVFNGDIGKIESIDTSRSLVSVAFEDVVEYTLSELDDLVPAYAISVHKSQGSEFRCVVMPVSTQHFIMLKRNLLYTAVTRARELAVLVGDIKALAIAVKNDQSNDRFTTLEERLCEEIKFKKA